MEKKRQSIELTLYEWSLLLKELEFKMGFRNEDVSIAKFLYEKIATQIYGQEVKLIFKD